MKQFFVIVIILVAAGSMGTACSGAKKAGIEGTVRVLVGTADVNRNGKMIPLKVGDRFSAGEIVSTGPKSIMVASVDGSDADIEMQENAILRVAGANETRELDVEQGNLWLRVNKLMRKGEEFSLKTRTTVASVRGTQLYSFNVGDYHGTCICRGRVNYTVAGRGFNEAQSQDHMLFSRGDKTVVLTPADLAMINPASKKIEHRHSMMDGSPLGPRANMSPAQMAKLLAIVERKFRNAR